MSHPAKTIFKLTLTVVAITFGATLAIAQTADGQTPAVEDVCDDESGAAFGLCNAYCEAIDCDLGFDEEPYPYADETACLRVKANYIKITAKSELPCEAELCPVDGPLGEACPCNPDDDLCDASQDLTCDGESGEEVCTSEDSGGS